MARDYQTRWVLFLVGLMAVWAIGSTSLVQAQDSGDDSAVASDAADSDGAEEAATPEELSLFNLIIKGGWFMVPIAVFSIVLSMFFAPHFRLKANRIRCRPSSA